MKIKTGQTWQSKDPRDGGRQVKVIEVDTAYVEVRGRRTSRIRIERFLRDYVLVKDVAE